MKAVVALGSNLGDRFANMQEARNQIGRLARVSLPMQSSAIYETQPVDCEPGTREFLNAVIVFEYQGDARELLQELKSIEKTAGRPNDHVRNSPRTLDLDLLCFGDAEINTAELQLPHPRMTERKFVMAPLADLCPDLIPPRETKTVRMLLAQLDDASAVVRCATQW